MTCDEPGCTGQHSWSAGPLMCRRARRRDNLERKPRWRNANPVRDYLTQMNGRRRRQGL